MSIKPIIINFSLPASSTEVFNFIVLPENMPLYSGFLLVPGIKVVNSSDKIRKVGTVDTILNTDGSSHTSVTNVLEPGLKYELSLGNISPVGWKKNLANPLDGFRECWHFEDVNGSAHIKRELFILYKRGFFNELLIRFFIRPQLYFSLLCHHRKLMAHKLPY